jgi:beta-lactamase regulating signal transducer with metallopeptidase domain
METILEVGLGNALAATVLALGAAVVSRLLRRPALSHTLWVLVLLKLVTPPLVPCALPWSSDGESVPAAGESPHATAEPFRPTRDDAEPAPPDRQTGEEMGGDAAVPEPDPVPSVSPPFPWRGYVGAGWLAGTVVWAVWVTCHVCRFRHLLRRAGRAPGELRREAEALACRLGLGRCPAVWLVPGAVCPMVWGLGGRSLCLLFPSGLLERLDAEGRAALLAHELAHVRRRDHWVRALELIVTGLYWWHPAVWWARREVHEAEELCCDAWAVWASGGDGRPYALALLQAVAFVSQVWLPLPAGASGVGQVSHLKRRLAMVLQGNTSRSLSWTGLGLVLGFGLLVLPLFPARAQEAAPPAKDTRDQQIDALKKAIEVLENEKRQEPVKAALDDYSYRYHLTVKADVVDQGAQDLQAELQALEKAIALKQKELQDLEARSRALRAQMAKASARPPKVERPLPPKVARPVPPLPTHGPTPLGIPTAPAAPPKAPDLEQKLDRLLFEVENLRRELHKNRSIGQPPAADRTLTPPSPVKPPIKVEPPVPPTPATSPTPATNPAER